MKKKILFILHLPPPVHGASLMGEYVHTNKKINETFDCKFLNLSAAKSIDTIGKASSQKVIFFVQLVFSTIKSVVSNKYALCYVTLTSKGPAFYKDFLIVTILKIFRKKILLHFHNRGVAQGARENKINHFLYQFALGGKKTNIILLSPLLYPDVSRYVKADHVFYCANGIPLLYQTVPAQKTPNKKVNILFLSNMIVSKGIFTLLDACVQLKKENKDFECHFVGDWLDITENSFHQKVTELGLTDIVFAHGKKYGTDKNKFYEKADIFVFPTQYDLETFGLVLLEAMQFELPVIATGIGGIPDIILNNETGYIIDKNNPAELADKLTLLINDPLLRESMGKAGKKRFDEKFTLSRFENRMTAILNEFAAAG